MQDQTIHQQFEQMPPALKQEVRNFMEFLLRKYHLVPKRPVFGSAKGKYELAPDFDEPLEDFKEYME
ncbi:MAG: DUF2281 domain-containing protein [Bacteroidetes bacterium]|nr:MAG: DUF2281 domain-containing protein [Bacteroidota bacterium]